MQEVKNQKYIPTDMFPAKDLFELSDAGHCYLRVVRQEPDKFRVHRLPCSLKVSDIEQLYKWAKEKTIKGD